MSTTNPAQRLAELKKREQNTREAEIRLNAQRENIEAEFEKLKKQAIKEHGTCDLDELRALFSKAKSEDDRSLKEFEDNIRLREDLINTIQQSLSRVSSQVSEA